MEDYTPNSHKYKKEQVEKEKTAKKKIEKVTVGSAKLKKKSGVRKFADVFIAEDIDSVKSHLWNEVFMPAAKKIIVDVVTNGISMMVYGETGRVKGSSATRISYGNRYEREETRRYRRPTSNIYDYDDILFESRGDAEAVLDAMNDILMEYKVVSIADLYDLADVPTSNYNANNYGWMDIRNADIVRTMDGYIIKMPKALALN